MRYCRRRHCVSHDEYFPGADKGGETMRFSRFIRCETVALLAIGLLGACSDDIPKKKLDASAPGNTDTGGSIGTGGATPTGGSTGTGGVVGTGGAVATGGAGAPGPGGVGTGRGSARGTGRGPRAGGRGCGGPRNPRPPVD